jgi:hypothetical protein
MTGRPQQDGPLAWSVPAAACHTNSSKLPPAQSSRAWRQPCRCCQSPGARKSWPSCSCQLLLGLGGKIRHRRGSGAAGVLAMLLLCCSSGQTTRSCPASWLTEVRTSPVCGYSLLCENTPPSEESSELLLMVLMSERLAQSAHVCCPPPHAIVAKVVLSLSAPSQGLQRRSDSCCCSCCCLCAVVSSLSRERGSWKTYALATEHQEFRRRYLQQQKKGIVTHHQQQQKRDQGAFRAAIPKPAIITPDYCPDYHLITQAFNRTTN